MRTFIAIGFPEEIQEYLTEIQQRILNHCKKGNPTKLENLHVTLRFLGEVKPADLDLIKEAMAEAAFYTKAFSIRLGNIGFFQRQGSCIPWVGLANEKPLEKLFYSLEKSLGRQGFPREKRKFSPHITLAREAVLFTRAEELKKIITVDPKPIEVNQIQLMESLREKGSLVYRPLYTQKLKDE